jgi:signal peptidase
VTSARTKNLLGWVATIAIVVAWFVAFRPPILGGPATTVAVRGHSMDPTFHNGDLVILHRRSTYRIGDVVAYRIPDGELAAGARVVHRIVGGNAANGFVTRGDNNPHVDKWRPRPHDILGARWLHIPSAAAWLSRLRQPIVLATLAAIAGFFLVMTWSPRRLDRTADAPEPAADVRPNEPSTS